MHTDGEGEALTGGIVATQSLCQKHTQLKIRSNIIMAMYCQKLTGHIKKPTFYKLFT